MIEQKNISFFSIDIINFLGLFILTLISVYYLPPLLNKLFFVIVFATIWLSNRDYFWILFFICLDSLTLNFFREGRGDVIHRLPEFDIIGSAGLSVSEIIIIILFIKAFQYGKKYKYSLENQYKLILIWIIVLWILSFTLYGIRSDQIIYYGRQMLYFTLFFSVPRLISAQSIVFMFKIFVIFTVLQFFNQLMSLTTGFYLYDFITGKNLSAHVVSSKEFYRASSEMVNHQFFVLVFSLFFYTMKEKLFQDKYLIIFIAFSFLSLYITGTRGWILSFSLALIYFLVFVTRKKADLIRSGLIIFSLLIIIISVHPQLYKIFISPFQRTKTITKIAQGDLTAGGTLQRLTVRLPGLIEGIKKNPIVGWGFSSTYQRFSDGHVGWANQVLQMGIIGLLLFIFLWFNFWKMNKDLSINLSENNIYRRSLNTLNIGLLIYLGIHSTSGSSFNFTMNHNALIRVVLFFIFAELLVNEALEYEKEVNN